MTGQPTKPVRTRAQRVRAMVIVMGIAWALWTGSCLWQTGSGTWITGPAGTTITQQRRFFGWFWYLEIHDTRTSTKPGSVRTWHWKPARLVATVLVILAPLPLWFVLGRRHVRMRRVPGYCDECGYDLRVRTSDRCPECGAPVPPDTPPPAHAKPPP